MSSEAKDFGVYVVDPPSIPAVRPLLEAFVATGQSEWDATALEAQAALRMGDPSFFLWVVVPKGEVVPVGFLAAYVHRRDGGPEIFVPSAYIDPAAGRGAAKALRQVVDRWARMLGVSQVVARTRRGSMNGLSEPNAWKRLGFEYDSTIVRRRLSPVVGGQDGEGRTGADDNL